MKDLKNLPIVLNIVLAIGLIALYIIHFTSKPHHQFINSDISKEETGVMISEGVSIAWVNMDSVLTNYDMYFDIQKELEQKGRKMESDMNVRTRDFEKQMVDFQDKVQKGLVTRSQAQNMQQDLAEKEQQLYAFRDELRMKFAEEEQVMLRRIQQSINDFLKEYNKDKGFHVILSSTFGGSMLYGHPAIEITGDVLKGLNENYIKTRGTK